jgi:hypothetical protein
MLIKRVDCSFPSRTHARALAIVMRWVEGIGNVNCMVASFAQSACQNRR